MVQKLEAKPLQLPIESSWTNFLMNLVWPVIGPEFSAAMKDIIAPKLHNKLSFLAPITVEVDLGTVPPEFGEVEVLEDTEMGSFMDLKLHLHWHAKPKIVVTCKLGTVELTTMQLGEMCRGFGGFLQAPDSPSASLEAPVDPSKLHVAGKEVERGTGSASVQSKSCYSSIRFLLRQLGCTFYFGFHNKAGDRVVCNRPWPPSMIWLI
ncbi:unnamed protein product [Symbiodinium sp. KB8]|nr:unnamed protein product [Symbiodinium sp. KB8]